MEKKNFSANRRQMLGAGLGMAALSMTGFGALSSAAVAGEAPAGHVTTKPIDIRGCKIGEGKPKTIVPITAHTADEVRTYAAKIGAMAEIDMIEFRVDYLDIALDAHKVAKLSHDVVARIHGKPMILTFRTKKEGGVAPLDGKAYADYYKVIVREGKTDFIDVELNRGEALCKAITADAHAHHVRVVMSNHDFHGTAPAPELERRMKLMDTLGADILKVAVMPKDTGDVLKILTATWEMKSKYTTKPLITMAMAGAGCVTRLAGEPFGSAATFGMVGHASAPGQVDVHSLQTVLNILHTSMKGA